MTPTYYYYVIERESRCKKIKSIGMYNTYIIEGLYYTYKYICIVHTSNKKSIIMNLKEKKETDKSSVDPRKSKKKEKELVYMYVHTYIRYDVVEPKLNDKTPKRHRLLLGGRFFYANPTQLLQPDLFRAWT